MMQERMETLKDLLFKIDLPNHQRSLALAQSVVDRLVKDLGYGEREANGLVLAVEEAGSNVIQHAYQPGEQATFSLSAYLEKAKLVIRIQDRGLPFDFFHVSAFDPRHPELKGLGSFLMGAFTDEVRFLNLGREGKAFEIVKQLPRQALEAVPAEEAQPASSAVQESEVPEPASLTIRLFQPEDAGQVARCAYRAYGYSYLAEHLYIPERLIEMNRTGELLSVVAAGPTGQVYGHIALVFDPYGTSPESGQAFVMPEARGHSAFTRMKTFLLEEAKRRGIPGVWSEAVSIHPFSQKGNVKIGARECGVLLCFVPGTLAFSAIEQKLTDRQSLVLFFIPLRPLKSRVCLPERHREILETIYRNIGIEMEVVEPQIESLPMESVLRVAANYANGWGNILVEQFGADLIEKLRLKLIQLTARDLKAITLDLPIGAPPLGCLLPEIEALGFFFAGVMPRRWGSEDCLRLQYLNQVEVRPEEVSLASDYGRMILDYVLACAASRPAPAPGM